MAPVMGSSLWQLVYNSDRLTWAVMLVLFGMSVICWSILFYKLIIWRIKKKQLKDSISYLKDAKNLEDVIQITSKFSNTLPGLFLSKNLNVIKTLLVTEHGTKSDLSERDLDFIRDLTNSSIDSFMHQEDSYLSTLSVCASSSTLIGLFGTVWGLINAFIDISKAQSADIAAVAPGIAEALITTLGGLIVAIPALVMYYNLKSESESIEQSIIALSNRLLIVVEKQFNKSGVNNVFESKKAESWIGSRNNLDSLN